MKKIILLALCLSMLATTAHAWKVMVSWDPHTDPIVTGFEVYHSADAAAPKPWTLAGTVAGRTAVEAIIPSVFTGKHSYYVLAVAATIKSDPSSVVTIDLPLQPVTGIAGTYSP